MRNFVRARDDLAARQKLLWFLLLAPATFVAATIARFYSEHLNHRIRRLLA